MLIIKDQLAKIAARMCSYGLIAVLLTLFGLGKIKDTHEEMAISALQHIENSNNALFALKTPHIAVIRSGSGADYYRELAADQLGDYETHTLVNWTVDIKHFLSSGSLPIELYYQTDYENGITMQNMRVEGALLPKLVSQSILIE
ncbi:hypothetical protein [Parendozoicomonas sp. Alg238-R29]|uniref:hypothetical protein n=1 Tax=Parendozoicomonas sp. Alg238-R29 TaxID=2993446 RepID=UPI00248F4442|nr:hypothetical protein [Parendozoicomonas sp. Alg238-R29]